MNPSGDLKLNFSSVFQFFFNYLFLIVLSGCSFFLILNSDILEFELKNDFRLVELLSTKIALFVICFFISSLTLFVLARIGVYSLTSTAVLTYLRWAATLFMGLISQSVYKFSVSVYKNLYLNIVDIIYSNPFLLIKRVWSMDELKLRVSKIALEKYNLVLNPDELFEITRACAGVEDALHKAEIFCNAKINSLSHALGDSLSTAGVGFFNNISLFASNPKNLIGVVMFLGFGFVMLRSFGFEFSMAQSFNATVEGLRLARAGMAESVTTVNQLRSSIETLRDSVVAANTSRGEQIAEIVTRMSTNETILSALQLADTNLLSMVRDDRKIIAFILKALLDSRSISGEVARQTASRYVEAYLTSTPNE